MAADDVTRQLQLADECAQRQRDEAEAVCAIYGAAATVLTARGAEEDLPDDASTAHAAVDGQSTSVGEVASECDCESESTMLPSSPDRPCGVRVALPGPSLLTLRWPPRYPQSECAVVDFELGRDAPPWEAGAASRLAGTLAARAVDADLDGAESAFELLQLASEGAKAETDSTAERRQSSGAASTLGSSNGGDGEASDASAAATEGAPTPGAQPAPPAAWTVVYVDHMNAPALYASNLTALAASADRGHGGGDRLVRVVLGMWGPVGAPARFRAGMQSVPMDRDRHGKKCRERKMVVLGEGVGAAAERGSTAHSDAKRAAPTAAATADQPLVLPAEVYATHDELLELCQSWPPPLGGADWPSLLGSLKHG